MQNLWINGVDLAFVQLRQLRHSFPVLVILVSASFFFSRPLCDTAYESYTPPHSKLLLELALHNPPIAKPICLWRVNCTTGETCRVPFH